jgi:uncharacterized repeat protein (TIGR01451 family)
MRNIKSKPVEAEDRFLKWASLFLLPMIIVLAVGAQPELKNLATSDTTVIMTETAAMTVTSDATSTQVRPFIAGALNGEALALSKDGPGYAAPGSIITYKISLDNLDALTHTIHLSDTLPPGVSYVPGSATGGLLYDSGKDQLTWIGEVGPGTLGYTVTAVPSLPYVNLGDLDVSNLCDHFENCDEGHVFFDLNALDGQSYDFYGQTLSELYVSANGIIFGPEGWLGIACAACPQRLPEPAELNQVMAGLWRDMDTSNGVGQWYGAVLSGLLPNAADKVFYANWHDAGQFGDPLLTSRHAIAIVLNGQSEPAGRIYYIYDHISDRAALAAHGYTIGVENKDGREGLTHAFAPCSSSACIPRSPIGTLPADGSTLRWDQAIVGGSSAQLFTYGVQVNASVGEVITNSVQASSDVPESLVTATTAALVEYRAFLPVVRHWAPELGR